MKKCHYNDHADDGHAEAGHALAGIETLGEKRQRRADPQDDGEEMGELACEAQHQILARDFLDKVRPELRQTTHGLGLRQSCGRTVQADECLLDGVLENVHGSPGVFRKRRQSTTGRRATSRPARCA